MNDKYAEIANTLHILESKIFAHARLNQVETVESFLSLVINKAKLIDKVTLVADWDNHTIKDNYLYIIVSPQNEIPNIEYVERLFDLLIARKFTFLKFLKFVEQRSSESKNAISLKISGSSGSTTSTVLSSDKLKFLVGKSGADVHGRTIRITVHVDEVIDALLKPSESGEYWIPDPNLFYMLDLLIGEYYMTKHIASISFFPSVIFDGRCDTFQNIDQIRETMGDLLKSKHNVCTTCGVPSYRTKITNGLCIYCTK